VRLTDIGSDDFESHDGSHEWDRSSPCTCTNCDWEGTVAGLKEE
jgi:hypothetical protein